MDQCCSRPQNDIQNDKNNVFLLPERIRFRWYDYFTAFYCWLFSYSQTTSIKPGLYYLSTNYDPKTPILVTCNYFLTVFILWKKIRKKNVRLLIIDTKGVNVWCSSGKGQFNVTEILRQIERYPKEYITSNEKIELILPKLSFSGVSINQLKRTGIIPYIGPVYADDLPEYLDQQPFENKIHDIFKFNLFDRLFTLFPSIIQFSKYLLFLCGLFFLIHLWQKTNYYWQVFPLALLFGTLYIVLFPLLPTKNFTFKSIFLSLIMGVGYFIYAFFNGHLQFYYLLLNLLFLFSSGMFFGLYYTGNSGVSNYSLVKKEIIRFLPVTFILFMIVFAMLIFKRSLYDRIFF